MGVTEWRNNQHAQMMETISNDEKLKEWIKQRRIKNSQYLIAGIGSLIMGFLCCGAAEGKAWGIVFAVLGAFLLVSGLTGHFNLYLMSKTIKSEKKRVL